MVFRVVPSKDLIKYVSDLSTSLWSFLSHCEFIKPTVKYCRVGSERSLFHEDPHIPTPRRSVIDISQQQRRTPPGSTELQNHVLTLEDTLPGLRAANRVT